MRIGYFFAEFPYKTQSSELYAYSGASVVVYKLVVKMADMGNEVDVFTTSVNSKDSKEVYKNITIYRYGTNFRMLNRNISLNMLFKPLKHDEDVIHVHAGGSPLDFASLLYMKRKNKPLILTYHGDVIPSHNSPLHKLGIYFYNRLVEKLLSSANVIISPSEYYINESKFLKNYEDKIIVIPNGIDIEDFDIPYSKVECKKRLGISLNENIILFLGALHPIKGPDILIKATPKIIEEFPNTKLILVGIGPMRKELEKLSTQFRIEDHVKFAGFVEENLKPLYYRAADVFCLPSTMSTEVFPITLLEASASGLPMIVSDLQTFNCMIKDGYNGIFTKRGNEESLANGIIHLLDNADMGKRMGRNARKKVENYSWKRVAEETERVYEKAVSS